MNGSTRISHRGRPLVVLAAAFAVVTSLASSWTHAQSKPAVTLRYTTGAPAKTPWVMQLERYAKDVDEESKGTLKIDGFIAAQLGNEQDTVQQVARGRIDMGGFSNGSVALLVPELGVLQLPFWFKSTKELDCVLDGPVTGFVTELLARKGVQFLGWTEVGTGDLVGKRPFLSPKDVNGLKAAAQSSKVNAMFWTALGANPSFVGITEITSAFQTGLVDVQANVVTFYLPSGLAKVAPVLTRLDVSDAPGIVLMNKGAYDRLSPEHKAALQRAGDRAPAAQLRGEIRGFEETLRRMHVQAGGQVVQATPEQREEWRKAITPTWPAMVKETGGQSAKMLEMMEAGRATCAKTS